jgi:O-antigen/teichoic acid export membrane protein
MTQKLIPMALILLLMVLEGALDATYEAGGLDTPIGWSLALALSFSFLCFLWYRRDSDERHYARSRWLNTGMVVLSVFAMPYYLWRSRPPGQKVRALLRCAGFALLMVLATAVGMLLSGHAI